MKPHLFALPEYDWAFLKFVHRAINELIVQRDPILSRIKTVAQPQLPTVRNTMPSGEVVDQKPFAAAMPFVVDFRDVIAGDANGLFACIDKAADQALAVIMPQFFERLGKMCEAAGTSVDAKGQALSHDLLLDTFEKTQIDFDEEGNAKMPTLVMHPDMVTEIERLPPPTEEQIARFRQMIERKKQEFNDRKRRRKLS